MNRDKLKSIVLFHTTTGGKIFDLVIQALIVTSIVTFTLHTLPGKSDLFYRVLNIIETITIIIFSVEYILRIILSDHKLKFIFSFYGLIDLLAILPYYIAPGLDLRAVRALRLLRLYQLFRFSHTIGRIRKALHLAKKELILFYSLTVILIYLAGVGIYYFERDVQPEHFASIIDSLWYGLATITTVGYGDVYPVTAGGKIFTFFILMIGMSVIAIPAGIIAAAITKAKEEYEGN